MPIDRNPQAEPMAHESMVRNLTAQAEAIWPQERELVRRYPLPRAARILDLGCGTGEIVLRLAEEFAEASVLGVDLHQPHLDVARERCRRHGRRIEFRRGDAFALELPERSFDLVLCRHMLQAVPEPWRVLEQIRRVAKPGGVVHLAAEDYGMIHFHPCTIDAERFFREGPMAFGARTGTDLRSGRKAFTWLRQLGFHDARVDYVMVDTVRVPRAILVAIFEAWRDGYAEIIAANTDQPRAEVAAGFDAIVASLRDPDSYGVWQLPIVSGRAP